MDRETRCRLAADAIAHNARHYLRPIAPSLPDADAAQDKTRRKAEEILRGHFAGEPSRLIAAMLDEARRHEQNVRMTEYDPSEAEDDPEYRSPADVLRKALGDGLRELGEITDHVCTFPEDSPDMACPVCGNSGLV